MATTDIIVNDGPGADAPSGDDGRPVLRVVIDGAAAGERAIEAARTVGAVAELMSAPDGASHWGAAGFAALIAVLRSAHPHTTVRGILDCGDAAGFAAAAVDTVTANVPPPVDVIVFSGHAAAAAVLRARAAAVGVRLLRQRPAALWLRPGGNAAAAARDWLAANR